MDVETEWQAPPGARGIVGHIGRRGMTFALTDGGDGFDPDTARFHDAASSSSVAGAIVEFQRAHGLTGCTLPSAFAVAGLVRGDAISVTHTRLYISRSGLQAMLGHPPLLLNDFEAEAWALARRGGGGGAAPSRPGIFVIAGMTSGMGVSVLRRKEDGAAAVLATEAGHAAFAPPTAEIAALVAALFPGRASIPAEALVSAPGLIAIYRHLAGDAAHHGSPESITAAQASDPVAARACRLLAIAFAGHVANLVLAYGAWDGVVAVGGLAMAVLSHFDAADVRAAFAGDGKYARLLSEVPWRVEHVRHGELSGAAATLAAAAAKVAAQPPERAPVAPPVAAPRAAAPAPAPRLI